MLRSALAIENFVSFYVYVSRLHLMFTFHLFYSASASAFNLFYSIILHIICLSFNQTSCFCFFLSTIKFFRTSKSVWNESIDMLLSRNTRSSWIASKKSRKTSSNQSELYAIAVANWLQKARYDTLSINESIVHSNALLLSKTKLSDILKSSIQITIMNSHWSKFILHSVELLWRSINWKFFVKFKFMSNLQTFCLIFELKISLRTNKI